MRDRDATDHELGEAQPVIRVCMEDDVMVLRPVGGFDRDAVEVLAAALAACEESGVTAFIDLDDGDAGEVAFRRWNESVVGIVRSAGSLRLPSVAS